MKQTNDEKTNYEKAKEYLQLINDYNKSENNSIVYSSTFEKIGGGAMGTVYDVAADGIDEKLVMKHIYLRELFEEKNIDSIEFELQQSKIRKYCYNECNNLKLLKDNDYVTKFFDAYVLDDENVFVIIMKRYISLTHYIHNNPITDLSIIKMAKNVLQALVRAQELNIVHRDIKPSNLYVETKNGKTKYVLGDFGISREIVESIQRITPIGTGAFKAPELDNDRDVNPLTIDIFSLGATLFNIVTGGKNVYDFYDNGETPSINDLRADLKEIILKAVNYYSDERYQSAREMLNAVERLDISRAPKLIKLNTHMFAAKYYLIQNDMEKVEEELKQGIQKSNVSCKRMYLYLHIKQLSSTQIYELKKLAEGKHREDNAAEQWLWGMYLWNIEKNPDEGKEYIGRSAQNGYVLGCYFYGRILYEEGNVEEGLKYCEMAAEEGLIPAVVFVRRRYLDSGSYLSGEDIENTRNYKARYNENRARFFIEFL